MIPKLKAGDIILSRTNTRLSKMIRWFEMRQTGSASYSHASLALGDLTEKPEVIESLLRVSRRPLSKYEGKSIIIYRMSSLTPVQCNEIALRAVSVQSQGYGWLKMPLFALDGLFRTYWFTSHLGVSHWKVCSEMIAWSYEKVLGYKPFGIGWRSVSPEVIADYSSHTKAWEEVYKN